MVAGACGRLESKVDGLTAGTETETDRDLALRARHERAAFAVLYDRYVTRIYHYCYRRTEMRHDAEDATSAIFTRALERIDDYRGGSFAAWLFAIARSALADSYRRRTDLPMLGELEVIDDRESPEAIAERASDAESVGALLANLPAEQREVVELRLAGLSGREIAGAMGRSVDAVKMLQLRAMKRLRAAARAQQSKDEVV